MQDYMASKRPVWTTGRMARELGVQAQSVRNWISKGMTPPIETVFTVLAKLNIPLATLSAYYQQYGVAMPTLMNPDQLSRTVDAGGPGGAGAMGRPPISPALSQAELAIRAEVARQREWDEMLAHTRTAMTAAGFPESIIALTLKQIEDKRNEVNPFQRYIEAEHREEEIPQQSNNPHAPSNNKTDERLGSGL
jgi:hypothetical protein